MQFSRPNWSWSFEVIKIRVWRQNNWYYATVIKPCCFFFFFFSSAALIQQRRLFLTNNAAPSAAVVLTRHFAFICVCAVSFFLNFLSVAPQITLLTTGTHTHTHTRWHTILGTFSWCEWTLEALMSLPVSWFFLTGRLTLLSWWTNIYPDTS